MTPASVDCELVSRLIGAWHDRELSETDRERFEEHLLVCPPCMDLNDNMQRALTALRDHADTPAPEDVVERMLAYARELPDG